MDILTLTAQLAHTTTPRGQRFISKVMQYSALLPVLMNFTVKATKHQYQPADGSQTVLGRALNADFTPASMTPANVLAGTLSAHGFFLKYDQSYVADHDNGIGGALDQWYEDNLDDKAYDTAAAIDALIVAGTGTNNTMQGIATILSGSGNVTGFSITMVIDAVTGVTGTPVSLDLTSNNNDDILLEQMDKWKGEVQGANALICNESMKSRLTTIARRKHALDWDKNEFGNPIAKVNGLAIHAVPDSVITKIEEDNTSVNPLKNTTSLYIFNNVEGLWNINTNSGLAFYDHGQLSGAQQEGVGFEFRAKNEIKRKRAIRRVRNLKV